jgi:DnaJ like chaperone protein
MAAGKWLGGFIGFMAGGPLGALAGLVLGAIFDVFTEGMSSPSSNTDYTNSANYSRQQFNEGQRNSFLFSLLVLASYIIKADGKVMHSEMELVRNFLRSNFGEASVLQGEQILHRLFEEQDRMNRTNPYAYKDTIRQCCAQIAVNLSGSERLQLLNFLVLISQADGVVSPEEVIALKEVAGYLGLSTDEIDSMLNLKGEGIDNAYKVLEISPSATNDEVRSAYRKLALKHHPDRVATLGEDIRNAAQKKFQEINDAKDKIYKARGM